MRVKITQFLRIFSIHKPLAAALASDLERVPANQTRGSTVPQPPYGDATPSAERARCSFFFQASERRGRREPVIGTVSFDLTGVDSLKNLRSTKSPFERAKSTTVPAYGRLPLRKSVPEESEDSRCLLSLTFDIRFSTFDFRERASERPSSRPRLDYFSFLFRYLRFRKDERTELRPSFFHISFYLFFYRIYARDI